jgi:hypothetical protein
MLTFDQHELNLLELRREINELRSRVVNAEKWVDYARVLLDDLEDLYVETEILERKKPVCDDDESAYAKLKNYIYRNEE